MPVIIEPEKPADRESIRAVVVAAFGQPDEARLVDELRAQKLHVLSLVARLSEGIVGHVLFSRIWIETPSAREDAFALAPMAVTPSRQRTGIGSELIRRGLELCRERGERAVLVLGHAEYYPRFGFAPEAAAHLECEYAGPHFMGLDLVPGTLARLQGRVVYSPPFGGF